jgi:hypothetical protein
LGNSGVSYETSDSEQKNNKFAQHGIPHCEVIHEQIQQNWRQLSLQNFKEN